MKASLLRAVILGLLIGPGPVAAERPETEPAETEPAVEGREPGHAVRGVHFHVWEEDAREASSWGEALLEVDGDTPAAARWRRVAARTAGRPPLLGEELESQLAGWGLAGEGDGGADVSPLGSLLCLLPGIDRTCLVCSWATSPEEATRRAIARALSAPFDAVGLRSAIEHLERDPSAEVRRLARSAAARHRGLLG